MKLEDVGRWLAVARQSRAYTQVDVALKLGVSVKTISRWEHSGEITMAHFLGLCELYRRWPVELFADSPVRVLTAQQTQALNELIDSLKS